MAARALGTAVRRCVLAGPAPAARSLRGRLGAGFVGASADAFAVLRGSASRRPSFVGLRCPGGGSLGPPAPSLVVVAGSTFVAGCAFVAAAFAGPRLGSWRGFFVAAALLLRFALAGSSLGRGPSLAAPPAFVSWYRRHAQLLLRQPPRPAH
jgi:hypothetical protein